MERHSSSVLAKHFTLWQRRLQQAQQLAEFQQLVTERGVRARKRRALAHWRHCISLITALSDLHVDIPTIPEGYIVRVGFSRLHTQLHYSVLLYCVCVFPDTGYKMWSWNSMTSTKYKSLPHTITLP